MGAVLAPPSLNETRSAYADWLEIQALTQPRRLATAAAMSNFLDIAWDDVAELDDEFDAEANEPIDNDIIEADRDALTLTTFEELEYRERVLGDSYPFRVEGRDLALYLKNGDLAEPPGRGAYISLLLMTALREKRLQLPEDVQATIPASVAQVLQVYACLAACGYVGGEVASFGFPRADGTGFLPALERAFERFGFGTVRKSVPSGLPGNLKDGGIDIIAWRDHPDRMPGKLYLLGQCASGVNWRDKSVREYIEPLHGAWFSVRPATDVIPAMFIPFTAHGDLKDDSKEAWPATLKNHIWYQEMRYGIVFDRLRIAHYVNECIASDDNRLSQVDGHDQLGSVNDWTKAVLDLIGIETSE
jgi:hypothetical protein